MNHVWSSLGALLFPSRCLICNHPVGSPFFSFPGSSIYASLLCADCAAGLPSITGLVCAKCGYPRIDGQKKHVCVLHGIGRHLELIRSGYLYEGMMMESIQRWKYQQRHLLLPLIRKLVDRAMERWKDDFLDVDVIAAVPLAAADWRARGFNQALIIAGRCALCLGKPLHRRLLLKNRRTPKQARLHRSSRITNLTGAFHVKRSHDLAGKTVLLCDDVMTTGSTLAVAGDVLLQAGAKAVKCFTLCRVL